jgi:hypothetical protein
MPISSAADNTTCSQGGAKQNKDARKLPVLVCRGNIFKFK